MIENVDERAEYFKKTIEGLLENIVRCPSCGNTFPHDGNSMECDLALEEYLKNNVEITYKINSEGKYLSCCILKEYGGPNTYIDTETGRIEVYWGGDRGISLLEPEILIKIDSIMERHYCEIIRRRDY